MNEEYNEEALAIEPCNGTQATAFYKVVVCRSCWKLFFDMPYTMHCSELLFRKDVPP